MDVMDTLVQRAERRRLQQKGKTGPKPKPTAPDAVAEAEAKALAAQQQAKVAATRIMLAVLVETHAMLRQIRNYEGLQDRTAKAIEQARLAGLTL